MKPKLILKSLADLPGNTRSLAAAMPGRALKVSRATLGSTTRATRREIRAARRRAWEFAQALYAQAHAPFESALRWQRGGWKE
jgi:hypothetical protein